MCNASNCSSLYAIASILIQLCINVMLCYETVPILMNIGVIFTQYAKLLGNLFHLVLCQIEKERTGQSLYIEAVDLVSGHVVP